MKKYKSCLIFALCAMLLSGCQMISSGDDLLQSPKPSQEYTLLQEELQKIMGTTMSYAAPQSGSYRNAVTFVDIDGDDTKEAIAFLREESGGKIYVYAFQKQNDAYQEIGSIEGPGTAIGAMDFVRVNDGAERLFVLTWTLSGGVGKGLTVYNVQNGKLNELLDTNCTDYTITDLDQDGTEELFTLSYEATGRKTAQVYDYSDDQMTLLSQAYASQDVQTAASIQSGQLSADGTQAVFVDNKIENDNGMQTDIYVLDSKRTTLRNLTQTADTSTYRETALYFCEDIDGNAVIEVPQLSSDAEVYTSDGADNTSLIDWYQFDADGEASRVLSTYKSPTEGWLLRFPEAWRDHVMVTTTSGTGVTETVFMERGTSQPLVTIYVFTGDDRKEKAAADGLIDLGSTADICYAAAAGTANKDSTYQLSDEEIKDAFQVVVSDWSMP